MDEAEKNYERELIQEFKKGNRERFDELVRNYTPKLFRFAYGLLGNRDDAEEVVQDAFVRAYRALDAFRGDSSFGTWIHRITMNLARNKFHWNRCRGEGMNVSLAELDAASKDTENGKAPEYELPDSSWSPDSLMEKAEFEKNVLAGLQALPDTLKAAMILRHVRDMSYEQIASVLDCKIGTVKSRISRGRELLRDYLLKADLPGQEPEQESGLRPELKRTPECGRNGRDAVNIG